MTHSEGSTVSHQIFCGFRNIDITESLIKYQSAYQILSKLYACDYGIVDAGVNDKEGIMTMIEDHDAVDRESKMILEISGTDYSDDSSETSEECARCIGTNDPSMIQKNEYSQPGEYDGDDCNTTLCDESKISEDGVANNSLLVNQNIKVDVRSIGSHSGSDCKRRGPSPLLFTPVKGEDLYGFISPKGNSQVTPTHAVNIGSSSINLGPVFCMPSPRLAKINSVSTPDRSTPHIYAGVKRSSQLSVNQSSDAYDKTSQSNEQSSGSSVSVPSDHMHGKRLKNQFESPSPPKCFRCTKETAAQIDSSPSPSKCSDSSFFITPKKVEAVKPTPEQLKLVRPRIMFRTKWKHRLRTLVSRARHSLSGIPPPPTFTMPQISVDEMLNKLKRAENNSIVSTCDVATPNTRVEIPQNIVESIGTSNSPTSAIVNIDELGGASEYSFVVGLESGCQFGTSSTSQLKIAESSTSKDLTTKSLFRPSATEKEILEMSWPAVLDCVHLGVCYDLGNSSEALEDLCQQVRERYVGNETASSCTVWSVPCATKGSSPRQRKNGKLLSNITVQESYMTRKRRAFSLASLTSTIPTLSTKSRQILVNKVTKKSVEANNVQRKVQAKDKGTFSEKEDPKISLIKRCLGENEKNTSKLNSMRRSLSFNDRSASSGQSSSSLVVESSTSSLCLPPTMLLSTKRVLKFDRLTRAASSPSLDACSMQTETGNIVSVAHNSCEDVVSRLNSTPNLQRTRSSCSVKTISRDLSEVHKKKLLWAVAEALRSRGLGTGHENFKVCAIPLYRCCRDAFLDLPASCAETSIIRGNSHNTPDTSSSDIQSVGSSDSQKERTSDKMLSIALGLVDKIMDEVGVEAVIKDRALLT